MADLHANFAASSVAVAPSPATSGVTLTVQTGDGALFPTPPFNCIVCPAGAPPRASTAEIVRVTGLAGDVFTFTRGPQAGDPGGINRSIAIGDQFFLAISRKTFTDIENSASYPASGTTPVITTNQVAANPVLANYLLAGDANPAFSVKGDGTLSWGPGGSTAADTTLARTAAGQLTLTGGLITTAPGTNTPLMTYQVAGWSAFSNRLLSTDTAAAFRINGDGTLSWGPGGSTATDVTLSRAIAGGLAVNSAVASNSGVLYTNQNSASGYTGAMFIQQATQALGTGFNFIQSLGNGVTGFYVRGDGHIYSTSTTITSTSDEALKDDIRPLEGALTAIRALKPRRFTWNDHVVNAARVGQEDYGLVAQEVEQVLPHLVGDDFQWKEDEDPLKSFRMGDLMPWVIAGMQEMAAEIDALRLALAG